MADERQLPPDGEPSDTAPTDPPCGGDELNETRPHDRFPDPAGSGAADPRPANPWGSGPEPTDPAEPTDSAEPTDPWASGDETRVLPPPDTDRWRARAGVPPAQPPEAVPAEPYLDQTNGRWWAPAALALVALVLLGLLGAGTWLILRAGEKGTVPPAVPSSPSSALPTSRSAPPSPTKTTSPAPSEPSLVAVPSVVGHSLADAQEILDEVGLRHQVSERVDANATPGTVLAATPAPTTRVPLGSTVTLYVAVSPATTAPPPTTSTPTPSATPEGN